MSESGVGSALQVAAVVFAFDPDPGTAPGRALRVLRTGQGLPAGELGPRERFAEAALRVAGAAGLPGTGRRSAAAAGFQLVALEDQPARRRSIVAWYAALTPLRELAEPGEWTSFGRGSRALFPSAEVLRLVSRHLRREARTLAGAVALLGDVFTADDLLRLHIAVNGGPEGSERTFRRRVQELRDAGALRRVRPTEVGPLRGRVVRFRSPAGTGGRPPELLRYGGSGGDEEQFAVLRSRRAS